MNFLQRVISWLLLIADGFLANTCNAVSLLFFVFLIVANFSFFFRIFKAISEERKNNLKAVKMKLIHHPCKKIVRNLK